MVDILTILEGLAYVGFIAGAIFAVMELRTMSRDRKTELMMRSMEVFTTREFAGATTKTWRSTATDAKGLEQDVSLIDLTLLCDFMESLAFLARRGLIDRKMLIGFYPVAGMWEKVRPWAMAERAVEHPDLYADFEWLAQLEMEEGV